MQNKKIKFSLETNVKKLLCGLKKSFPQVFQQRIIAVAVLGAFILNISSQSLIGIVQAQTVNNASTINSDELNSSAINSTVNSPEINVANNSLVNTPSSDNNPNTSKPVLVAANNNIASPANKTPAINSSPLTNLGLKLQGSDQGIKLLTFDDNSAHAQALKKESPDENSKIKWDLVAILVDEDLAGNQNSYDGLKAQYSDKLQASTILDRIQRYAKDVQGMSDAKDANPYTKTVIIKVKKNEPTQEIAATLEKLYLEGDGTPNEKNQLAGVVIVGDVPLPVVNKSGNHFVSIFPYTDFVDPYYVFDPKTKDFILNNDTKNPGADIWHGLIVPPLKGEEGNKLLAEYFDKNHLFHAKEPAFYKFAKKIFYSDFFNEFKLMSPDGLGGYANYLKYWEDVSYLRYNKYWAGLLSSSNSLTKPEGDGVDNDGDGKIDEDPVNGYDDDGDGEKGSPLMGFIDGKDNDGDGKIDNPEEGTWGFCGDQKLPLKGKTEYKNCAIPGKPAIICPPTGDGKITIGPNCHYYNVKPQSEYFVVDHIDNNNDGVLDEKIDEDNGDAYKGVDNDRDGRVDEDTTTDNDGDQDRRTDEDPPGDQNGDGCPGVCDFDDDHDSQGADSDFWPDGYERDYGTMTFTIPQLADFLTNFDNIFSSDSKAASENGKSAFDQYETPTDPEGFESMPLIKLKLPIGSIFIPRIFPWPDGGNWIDEGSKNDDDEDGKVDEDGTTDNNNDQDGFTDEDPANGPGQGAVQTDAMQNLPDIQTKPIIDQFLLKYNQLFDKFFSQINNWVDATGRYESQYMDAKGKIRSDIANLPQLIANKDEFTRIYLKAVNDAIEKRIDNYVENLQYPIQLVKGTQIGGYMVLNDNNGIIPNNIQLSLNPVAFINFGYRNSLAEDQLPNLENILKDFVKNNQNIPNIKQLVDNLAKASISSVLDQVKQPLTADTPVYINGKLIEDITNVQECTLYRGTKTEQLNSQMVVANSVYNPLANLNAEKTPTYPKEWKLLPKEFIIGNEGNDFQGLLYQWNENVMKPFQEQLRLKNEKYAGCYALNFLHPDRCFVPRATRNIFDLNGTREVNNVSEDATNYRACFDFKEKDGFDKYIFNVWNYLREIHSTNLEEERVQYDPDLPAPELAYTPANQIMLLDFKKPPATFSNGVPIPDPLKVLMQTANPSFSVNFGDFLKNYFLGDGVDNNKNGTIDDASEANPDFFNLTPGADFNANWVAVGEQILLKQKAYKFGSGIINGVKELFITVSPIVSKQISSLVSHKEPTNDTLVNQTYDLERDDKGDFVLNPEDKWATEGKYKRKLKTDKDGNPVKDAAGNPAYVQTRTALSMPIDNPRYVSFMDSKGESKKIVYPNAFQANNLQELQAQLKDLENTLKNLQKNPDYNGPQKDLDINGYLTNVIEPTLQDDVKSSDGGYSVISSNKLGDALQWKTMDIDQKHVYSLSHYLGSAFSPFTPLTESPNGYEALYLISDGNADGLSLKFNKDIPEPKQEVKTAKIDCSIPGANPDICKELPQPPGGTASTDTTGPQIDLPQPVMIWEWFGAMQKWAKDTNNILQFKNSAPACPGVASNESGAEGFQQTGGLVSTLPNPSLYLKPVDLNNDGKPDDIQNTTKLKLTLKNVDKNVLLAGANDQADFLIEGLDEKNILQNQDNHTKVTLKFKNANAVNDIAKIISAPEITLNGGQAQFKIASTDKTGTFTVTAFGTEEPKLQSEAIQMVSSKKNIRLISYRRYKNYSFVKGGAAGLSLKDANGKPIADINETSGLITIIDQNYELIASAASQTNLPTRLSVRNKKDQSVVMSLYFVTDKKTALSLDSSSVNFNDNFKTLQGVHVKDLAASDNFSLQLIPTSSSSYLAGGGYIIDASSQDNLGRVGIIDTLGNIYLNEGLSLKPKESSNKNDPVIFQIISSKDKPLFEAYLGAKFDTIEKLDTKGNEDLLSFLKVFEIQSKPKLLTEFKVNLLTIAHAAAVVPDSDKDGLNDLEEIIIGTNSAKADTDEDSVNDLDELNSGTDPLLKNAQLFKDLKPSDEAFSDILKLYRRGIFINYADGTIRPTQPITRDEFIKVDLGSICILCDRFKESIKKSVEDLYNKNPFPDLNIKAEYHYCIAEGKNRGIISGYKAFENAGFYVPGANISRAEATKVILETSRQQQASFPEFINEKLDGKPWYYNYVLTAQKEKFFPKGRFNEVDNLTPDSFKTWFDAEINNPQSQFIAWLGGSITRAEFAIMVSKFVDKYNCITADKDGDGLPDNFEKYIYGSNPEDIDTDHGGVNDAEEIIRKTDILNPEDDREDADNDGLTTYDEKTKYKTDPQNPDTDGGGIPDGDEVLRGTDPLDSKDDNAQGRAEEGAYMLGDKIEPNTIYSLPAESDSSDFDFQTEETDSIPADGESNLYIRATLYDDNGDIIKSDNSSIVRFGFKNKGDDQFSTLDPINLKVREGSVETVIKSKTVAGLPIVIAAVDGQNLPSDQKLIEVYPLEPANIKVETKSPIMASGGLSNTLVKATLRDKFGNIVNNGSYQLTFKVDSDQKIEGQLPPEDQNQKSDNNTSNQAFLDTSIDEDPKIPGIQVSSITGEYSLLLTSGKNPEKLTITASYLPSVGPVPVNQTGSPAEQIIQQNLSQNDTQNVAMFLSNGILGQAQVQTRDDLVINIIGQKNSLQADNSDSTEIIAQIQGKNAELLKDFKGEITFTLANPALGKLIGGIGSAINPLPEQEQTAEIIDGTTKVLLRSTKKAGKLILSAHSPGLNPSQLEVESEAGPPTKISLELNENKVEANPGKVYEVTAKLYDNEDNFVSKNSDVQVIFSIDPESMPFGNFVGPTTVKVQNGFAQASFIPTTLTGPLRIRVKAQNLSDGYTEVSTVQNFTGLDLRDIKPNVLFASMMGSDFGNVLKENYFGGWFIFSGRTESAVSLITNPKPYLKLAEVLGNGKVLVNDENRLAIQTNAANSKEINQPNRIVVRDSEFKKDLFEEFVILKPQSVLKLTDNNNLDLNGDTVNVVNLVVDKKDYDFVQTADSLSISRKGIKSAEIFANGNIILQSPAFSLQGSSSDSTKTLSFDILDSGEEIAQIIVNTTLVSDVNKVDPNFVITENIAPGIYLRPISSLPKRDYEISFSGNSTNQPKGYSYIDQNENLPKEQSPGLSYLSLESSKDSPEIGFTGDNKHMLLFSSGQSIGEANQSYASDGQVVLGDPTIHLDNKTDSNKPLGSNLLYDASGFTQDIGKQLIASFETIKEISPIDYNHDGYKDLFVSHENGDVRLLENENNGKEFKDKGIFLNFPTGILSSAVADFNGDGWEDFVVATKDSCRKGEICIDAYLNDHGNFKRQNLELSGFSEQNKIYMLRSADMNQDGFIDLVTSDDRGAIQIFYNQKGVILKQGSLVGSLASSIDFSANLKSEVMVNYPGMIGNQPGTFDDLNFEDFPIGENHTVTQFQFLDTDEMLGINSNKKAQDLTKPANILANGDQLLYSITLTNSSNSNLKNVSVIDTIGANLALDQNSIQCTDCKEKISIEESGKSQKPYIISGIDLPKNSSRTITYKAGVKGLPKIKILIGQNLSKDYPAQNDGFPDIGATPEQNPTGRMIYFYSVSKEDKTGKMSYGKYITPAPNQPTSGTYTAPPVDPKTGRAAGPDLSKLFGDVNEDGVPSAIQYFLDYGKFPPGVTDKLDQLSNNGPDQNDPQNNSQSGDAVSQIPGLGPIYDDVNQALDKAANKLTSAIGALTCSGGCLPLPVNFAFLATGAINVMGTPSGYDPGTPIFGWGVPPLVFVCSGPLCYSALGGRIYLVPTLTLKLAMSICIGPYPTGVCYSFVLPIDSLLGVCDAINGAIDSALSAANNIISGTSGDGSIGISSDGSLANNPDSTGRNSTGGFQASSSLGSYSYKANISTNFRVPGFPSVLTNWLDAQIEEIVNKLTDLPDIYVLFPDVKSFVGNNIDALKKAFSSENSKTSKEAATPQGLRDLLVNINKIPLLQVETKEVIVKIPALTPAEIEKFINDSKQWVQAQKLELAKIKNFWHCGTVEYPKGSGTLVPGYYEIGKNEPTLGSPPFQTACDLILADFSKTIASVEKNIEVLDHYKRLPRDILAWRNMFTKHLTQIICYIDSILNFVVGNTTKWLKQIENWVDAYIRLKEMITTWKAIFDLVVEYQNSCDSCTSARFTLLELILKLFAFIPSPPVIPFPKLPDIYIDLSQVQAGVKIIWPDIKFRPVALTLPKLPRITLPDLPNIKVELPAIPVLPDFSLPELPDLPPLNLPVLPDLPPPPKIPEFPASIQATISVLKKIFKIICLIKKGFVPVPETTLKSHIEAMTERGLEPLLPIDLLLKVQFPPIQYDYVEKIVVTAKVKLGIDVDQIFNFVQGVADKFNIIDTNFANIMNESVKTLQDKTNNAAAAVTNSTGAINSDGPTSSLNSSPLNQSNAKLALNDFDLSNKIGPAAALNPQLAQDYAMFQPMLAQALTELQASDDNLAREAEKYKKIAETDYKDIALKGSSKTLNPADPILNRSIADLEKVSIPTELLSGGEEYSSARTMASLRNNLLTYVKEEHSLDSSLSKMGDLESFGKLLAQAPSLQDAIDGNHKSPENYLASTSKLLAEASTTLTDVMKNSGLPANLQNKPVTKGMFIYNAKLKINKKLINYQDEVDQPNTMNFIDLDNDKDSELVYSYAGNIYLKENYAHSGYIGTFYGGEPQFKELNDLSPSASAILGFKAGFNGNATVDLSWQSANQNKLSGYELIYGKTLQQVDAGLNTFGLNKMVFLLPEALTTSDNASLNSSVNDSTNTPISTQINVSVAIGQDGLPVGTISPMYAEKVVGEVHFDGPEEKLLVQGSEKISLQPGQIIYSPQEAQLKIWFNGEAKENRKMAARETIALWDSLPQKIEVQVQNGQVFLINPKNILKDQILYEGGKIDLETKYYSVNEGSALIRLQNEAYTKVDAGQSVILKTLVNAESPKVSLTMDNGFYYASLRSFDQTGFRSTPTTMQLISPNLCSDKQAPFPNAGPEERTVSIFKTLKIDTSKSFDTFGSILSYYIDSDPTVDSDGDSDPTNDRNIGRDKNVFADSDGNGILYDDLDDPFFVLGPYKDLKERKVVLNVVDKSLNRAQQEITIKVIVPEITVDSASGKEGKISGSINIEENDIPVSILRNRQGVITQLQTKAANVFGKYFTNDKGGFTVDDLNLKDTVVIKNKDGKVIGEIDPTTGRVILKDPNYILEVLPAEEPLLPTRIVVKDLNGIILATVFIIPDLNTDVTLDVKDLPYNKGTIALFEGVHAKDTDLLDDFEFKKIPADSPNYPGGAEIIEKTSKKRMAILDTGGNFYVLDSGIGIKLKDILNLDEPMVFEITLKNSDGSKTVMGEFYITVKSGKKIHILSADQFRIFVGEGKAHGPLFDTDKDGLPDLWELQYGLNPKDGTDSLKDTDGDGLTNLQEYRSSTNPLLVDSDGDGYSDAQELGYGKNPLEKAYSPFDDVKEDNPYYKSILNLYQRNILKGIPAGNQNILGEETSITRAEFTKIMLDIFCIVPRPEAYQAPGVFSDIAYEKDKLPWYYAAVKEGYFQGFITGYLGEINKISGQTPFAPEASITRAEAVKVILEGLEREGVISLKDLQSTEIWYEAYMKASQNLEPYIVQKEKVKNTFILSSGEATTPLKAITKAEFIAMADRVLTAYDCSLVDDDGDGMPSYWEELHNLNPYFAGDAKEDPDQDGLTNLEEYKFGTDPFDPDTDKGGVKDGAEVKKATNPLNSKDDPIDSDGDGLTDSAEKNIYHTDPLNPDSDAGGINDGTEVLINNTDPLNSKDDKDSDEDGLSDFDETNKYHSDPLNPDTDGGGITDGAEVNRGTDPLNPADDLIDPRKDLEQGIYIIAEPCNSCPCLSSIDHTADFILGDKIFGIISNNDNSEIFSRSNEVQIEQVQEIEASLAVQ